MTRGVVAVVVAGAVALLLITLLEWRAPSTPVIVAETAASSVPATQPPATASAASPRPFPSSAIRMPWLPGSVGPLVGHDEDPAGLPRYPGATLTALDEGTDGEVRWLLVEYLADPAALDDVRAHYRAVFRDHAWFVGDVDYEGGAWTFAANDGPRETRVVIAGDDGRVATTVYVSDTVVVATPAPTATPTPTATPAPRERADERPARPRRPRARPRPNPQPRVVRPQPRPRSDDRPRRGGDRDRDDDDDDDDDDD